MLDIRCSAGIQRKHIIKLYFILSIIFLFPSCYDNIDRNRLAGQYVFSDLAVDTLELKLNGTYLYHTISEGKTLENIGKWKLNLQGNEILFENFSFLTDELPKGNWYSKVKLEGDTIHLIYASEGKKYYKKIN